MLPESLRLDSRASYRPIIDHLANATVSLVSVYIQVGPRGCQVQKKQYWSHPEIVPMWEFVKLITKISGNRLE